MEENRNGGEHKRHKRLPRVPENRGSAEASEVSGRTALEEENERKAEEVMTGYFSPFALLTADAISDPPRTHGRSNLKLLWTAVLQAYNQMKTFITRTLHRDAHQPAVLSCLLIQK